MARKWTDEEIEFLKMHAAEVTCTELLKMVNAEFGKTHSLSQLYGVKARLGIRSPNIGQFRKGIRNSPITEFKKGQPTWNKGISYQPGGRCQDTQFKKGHMPHNHRPVGSERICYGKIQIKIAEPKTWEWLAVLIWQSVHKQALPKDCIIRFANEDITDYSPDNLVAITKTQNVLLNQMHIHTYDAESLRTALLMCELRMQKNKRKKDVKRTKKRNHRNNYGDVGKIRSV